MAKIQDFSPETSNSGNIRFINVPEKYSLLHDARVTCEIHDSLQTSGDWIGLFPLGWHSVLQLVTYQWVPDELSSQTFPIKLTLSLPVHQLRKVNPSQYYQWAYINRNGEIKALSSRIYFFQIHDNFVVDESANEKALLQVQHERNLAHRNATGNKNEDTSTTCYSSPRSTSAVVPWHGPLPGGVFSSSHRFDFANDNSLNLQPAVVCQELLQISHPCHSLSSPTHVFTFPYPDIGNHSVFMNNPKESLPRFNEIAFNPDHPNYFKPIEPAQPTEQPIENERQPAPLGWMSGGGGEYAGDVPIGYCPVFEPSHSQPSAVSALNTNFNEWAGWDLGQNLPEQTNNCSTELGLNKSRDHLVSCLLQFLSVLRECPAARSSSPISCSKCAQMAVELSAARWRASQAENQQRNIINEILRCRSRLHQQEQQEQERRRQIEQLKTENIRLSNSDNTPPPVLEQLRKALATNCQIAAEKRNLEKKVTTLMWEKAGLCAKLQLQQQAEFKASGRAIQLNRALLEAQEENQQLVGHQGEMQCFIDALLATLGYLGYTAIKDPFGNRITLPTGTHTLELEPHEGENADGGMRKTRRPRPSDRWYKAVLAAQEETIHRLQTELANLGAINRTGSATICQADHPNECENANSGGDQNRAYGADHNTPGAARDTDHRMVSPMHQNDYERQGARPKIQLTTKRKPLVNTDSQECVCAAPPAPCSLVPPRERVITTVNPCPFCPQSRNGPFVHSDDEHLRIHMYSELSKRHWG